MVTACVRSFAPSLERIERIWFFTVSSLIESVFATILFEQPSATHRRTSISRVESVSSKAVRGDFKRYLRWNVLAATMNGPDRVEQIIAKRALEQITSRARPQGAKRLHIAFEGRQHNEPRTRRAFSDRCDRLDAADVGKREIHERHVRQVYCVERDRFGAVACLGDNLHVGLTDDQSGDTLPQHRVIVDRHDPDRRWRHAHAGLLATLRQMRARYTVFIE